MFLVISLAILGCATGVATGNAFVYIMSFTMPVAVILLGLLILTMKLIWKLFPGNLGETSKKKGGSLNATICFSIMLFYILGGVIDFIYLRNSSGLIRLLSNMIIFVFAAFWGWSLETKSKGKTVVLSSIVLIILFVATLSFVSSHTLKSGEIVLVNPPRKLVSLGYVDWVPAKNSLGKTLVTRYDPQLAFPGLNLYNSWVLPEAYLIDMDGNVVHKWARKVGDCNDWRAHVELCENGDLLVVASDRMLIRLDWDSNLKWAKKMDVHHDVSVDENKDIYVLMKNREMVFWHAIPVPIVNDYIVVLSSVGQIKGKICIYDLVKEQVSLHEIVKIYGRILRILKLKDMLKNALSLFSWRISECRSDLVNRIDLLHTNSVEVIDRNIEGFCKKGDLLISIRNLDLIGVVDAEKETFGWCWGPGKVSKQHHPMLLKTGNVLVFDNGYDREYSRIVEINPLTKKIVWEYKSERPEEFYTKFRGSSQRLPNGNTLITESDKGHVFEITKEGKIVWQFYNPSVKMESKERETIYRMMRIADPKIYKLVKK